MKTPAIIETGPDGGYDIVPMELECAAFFGNGDTIAEAKEDLLNSYKEVLEVYEEEGIPVPEELRNLEFEYKNDIASFLHELKWIKLSALSKVFGMNRSLLYQYKKGDTYISHQQMKRIEAGVHELGRKMLEFSVK